MVVLDTTFQVDFQPNDTASLSIEDVKYQTRRMHPKHLLQMQKIICKLRANLLAMV